MNMLIDDGKSKEFSINSGGLTTENRWFHRQKWWAHHVFFFRHEQLGSNIKPGGSTGKKMFVDSYIIWLVQGKIWNWLEARTPKLIGGSGLNFPSNSGIESYGLRIRIMGAPKFVFQYPKTIRNFVTALIQYSMKSDVADHSLNGPKSWKIGQTEHGTWNS